jgi:tRNA 5-methylaminomethyl-2-thiouridine biosynthesis bifunctional protein
MPNAPRSKHFDDIYFSAEDGLAETRHVFLDGNDLPDAWMKSGATDFTIFETGFGTGLNFLAVWDLFEKTANEGQALNFISVEKYPLSDKEILNAVNQWDFGEKPERMVKGELPSNVTLTVHIGDANDIMPTLKEEIDCWFLDGFKPATNPDMWSDTILQNMARMSKVGATFATFTAAGDVRRGLQAQGFDVQKTKGFGRKRDMLIGTYKGGKP